MGKTIDITGQKFGRLTVTGKSARLSLAGALWECSCDCGGVTVANSLKLRTGKTQSCGCYRKEILDQTTHGLSNKSRTYRTWKEMRNRCNNPNADNWKWYGGRGIKIYPQWDDYLVFLADMGERPKGKTLDRKDGDLDYSPENCRWATAKEQAVNNRGCFKKNVAK